MMTTAQANLKDHDRLADYDEGDRCPVHGCPVKKIYDFGMYRYAEVAVFKGCRCAVATRHDPVGILDSAVTYHTHWGSAEGQARLHTEMMKVKYH